MKIRDIVRDLCSSVFEDEHYNIYDALDYRIQIKQELFNKSGESLKYNMNLLKEIDFSIQKEIKEYLNCEYEDCEDVRLNPEDFKVVRVYNDHLHKSFFGELFIKHILIFDSIPGVIVLWDDNYFTFINKNHLNTFKQIKYRPLIKKSHKDFIDNFINQDKYGKYNIRLNKGLLISGEPGNGKTQILRYVECNYKAKFLNNADLSVGPGCLTRGKIQCIDDVDLSMFSKGHQNYNNIISNMDNGESRFIRIFSTNEKVEDLSPAILRPGRINEIYHIENPTREDREEFFSDFPVNLTEDTNGFSYAKLQFLKVCMIDSDFDVDKGFSKFNEQIKLSKETIGFAA